MNSFWQKPNDFFACISYSLIVLDNRVSVCLLYWYSSRRKGQFLLVVRHQVWVIEPCQASRRVARVSRPKSTTSSLLNPHLNKLSSHSASVLHSVTTPPQPALRPRLPPTNLSSSDRRRLPLPRTLTGRLWRYRDGARCHIEERTCKLLMTMHKALQVTVSLSPTTGRYLSMKSLQVPYLPSLWFLPRNAMRSSVNG